ncbi:hypothetical protein AVEN_33710-1, partial [Araneus ventricosus]
MTQVSSAEEDTEAEDRRARGQTSANQYGRTASAQNVIADG